MSLGRTVDARSRARGRDLGYTLIEVVVTVVLLGIVVVPVIDAVRTAISVSATSRAAANVESALLNAADRVNRAPLSCDYTEYAQAAVLTRGWAIDRATSDAVWYDPTTRSWSNTGGGCRFDGPTLDLVQRVTITITSPNGRIVRSIQVVKSRV